MAIQYIILKSKFSISHLKAIQYFTLKGNSGSYTERQFSISHPKAIQYLILKGNSIAEVLPSLSRLAFFHSFILHV
jgi:hypothetical protein